MVEFKAVNQKTVKPGDTVELLGGENIRVSDGNKDYRPVLEYRTCPICGQQFGINCQQRRKKYCDACKHQHYKDFQRVYQRTWRQEHRVKINHDAVVNRREKGDYMVYICALCGKEFQTGTKGHAKFCMECLEARKCEQPYRTYYERRKPKI